MNADLSISVVSATATQRSKIDMLSRKDLIYFVKKQLDNIKLLKEENAKLKEQSRIVEGNESGNTAEEEQLQNDNFIKAFTMESLKDDSNSNIDCQNEIKALKEIFKEQTEKLVQTEAVNERLRNELQTLQSTLDDANHQLAAFKERRNVENVFTMEMADYEKTVEKLQKELKFIKSDCEMKQNELDEIKKKAEDLRAEKSRLYSNITKMKTALVKLKSELIEKKKLLENAENENSDLKAEMASHFKEKNLEKMKLNSVITLNEEKIQQLESNISSLNRQLISLRSQRESLQRQYDDLAYEYNTFKTRALYVLERKKNNGLDESDGKFEMLEGTLDQQQKTIENMKNSNRLLQDELFSLREQNLALTEELRKVQEQLTTIGESYQKKLSIKRDEFESLVESEARLKREYKTQMEAISLSHLREKECLIAEAEQEQRRLEKELENVRKILDESQKKNDFERCRSPSDSQSLNLQTVEEKMQNANRTCHLEPEGISVMNINTENLVDRPLQYVLFEDDEGMDFGEEAANCSNINLLRQVKHMRELLNESEATNIHLHEQLKLLKNEIRRMQRNEERADHLANNEYLKNIILKFVAPEKVNSERTQLIPVLTTMLKLNADEMQLLQNVAEDDNCSSKDKSNWSDYLNVWSHL